MKMDKSGKKITISEALFEKVLTTISVGFRYFPKT